MKPNPEKLTCISVVICDDVYRDEVTKKLLVVGIFNAVNTRKLPCKQPKVHVLFTLTNCRGSHDLALYIEHERTGRKIVEISGPLKADNPLAMHDTNVELRDIVFPEAGKYWVVVQADGEIIQQRPFFVLLHEEPSSQNEPEVTS